MPVYAIHAALAEADIDKASLTVNIAASVATALLFVGQNCFSLPDLQEQHSDQSMPGTSG